MNHPAHANPLLDFSDLPLFDQVRPEHVAPAIDQLLADASAALETVTAPTFQASWTSMAKVLDVSTERLSRAWGTVSHLNGVIDTPELRAAYNESLPKVTEFWTRLGADERLYAKYKAMNASDLNAEQTQARTNAIRNFVLSGAELTGSAKARFAEIQERQAALSQKFSENTLDATDAWTYLASADELVGVPDDVLAATAANANANGKQGHLISLKMPVYLPIMQFANSTARKALSRLCHTGIGAV